MTRRAQTRPHAVKPADRLLAEAVRAYEEDGSSPLGEQDADTVGRQAGGDREHRVVARARALSVAGPLREALRHVRQATSLIVVVGVVLAAVAGAARKTTAADKSKVFRLIVVVPQNRRPDRPAPHP